MRPLVLDCQALLATSLPLQLLVDVLLPRMADAGQDGPRAGQAAVVQLLAASIRLVGLRSQWPAQGPSPSGCAGSGSLHPCLVGLLCGSVGTRMCAAVASCVPEWIACLRCICLGMWHGMACAACALLWAGAGASPPHLPHTRLSPVPCVELLGGRLATLGCSCPRGRAGPDNALPSRFPIH
jgi:hypothetical protein